MTKYTLVAVTVAAVALAGCSTQGGAESSQPQTPAPTVTVTESPRPDEGAAQQTWEQTAAAGGPTQGQAGASDLTQIAPQSGPMAAGSAQVQGASVSGLVAPAQRGGAAQVYDAAGWKAVTGKLAVPDGYPSPVHVKLITQRDHRDFTLRAGQAPVAFDMPISGHVFKIVYNIQGKPADQPAVIVLESRVSR